MMSHAGLPVATFSSSTEEENIGSRIITRMLFVALLLAFGQVQAQTDPLPS
jgi:hypothetical protein